METRRPDIAHLLIYPRYSECFGVPSPVRYELGPNELRIFPVVRSRRLAAYPNISFPTVGQGAPNSHLAYTRGLCSMSIEAFGTLESAMQIPAPIVLERCCDLHDSLVNCEMV